ncbi:MAG: DMT family transporter [Bacillota bacterium]
MKPDSAIKATLPTASNGRLALLPAFTSRNTITDCGQAGYTAKGLSMLSTPAEPRPEQAFLSLQESKRCDIYLFSIVTAILIWSVSFVATKIALNTFPPLGLGLVRFGMAVVLLGSFLAIRKEIEKTTPVDLAKLVVSGFLGITVYFTLENTGVKYSTASDAALIVASYPAITMLLETLIFRVKFPVISFVGVGLAIAGVYMIVSISQSSEATDRLFGNILLVLAGVVWACYNFVTRTVVSNYSMSTITFYQVAAGAIGFLPFIFLEADHWTMPTGDSLIAVIYLGVFCSLLAFYLYAYGLRQVSSSTAVMLMNLVPVFGVLFSVVILHEAVYLKQIVGGTVVIIGVMLSVSSAGNTGKTGNGIKQDGKRGQEDCRIGDKLRGHHTKFRPCPIIKITGTPY